MGLCRPDKGPGRTVRPFDAKDTIFVTQFSDLGLAPDLLTGLETAGYTTPSPIQARVIPAALDGRDIMGIAQTGTGKTAAFALPILDRLMGLPRRAGPAACRALILAPTRELVSQIAESIRKYAGSRRLSVTVIVGGVKYGPQIRMLSRGSDIIVATPGRLLDHMSSGTCRLDEIEMFVLDEADHMLDLGFVKPIRRIVAALPSARQSMFFSATMAGPIKGLADSMLDRPHFAEVTPQATTVERIDQQVILIEGTRKRDALESLLRAEPVDSALVFVRTKRGADRLAERLTKAGFEAVAIHGDKKQSHRDQALRRFKAGKALLLVATDIAARGIDISSVTHVFNYDLPQVADAYVHRIGRTARAGRDGVAVTFCDDSERDLLRAVEKLIRRKLPMEDMRLETTRKAARSGKSPRGQANGARGNGARGNGQTRSQTRPQTRSQHRKGGPRTDADTRRDTGRDDDRVARNGQSGRADQAARSGQDRAATRNRHTENTGRSSHTGQASHNGQARRTRADGRDHADTQRRDDGQRRPAGRKGGRGGKPARHDPRHDHGPQATGGDAKPRRDRSGHGKPHRTKSREAAHRPSRQDRDRGGKGAGGDQAGGGRDRRAA